jgi:methylated-DNA-[protein]-cysteine S-methyltransferase
MKMVTRISKDELAIVKRLRSASSPPPRSVLSQSRARLRTWLAGRAPLIQWDEMKSPLGPLFAAVSPHGLCALDFGRRETDFLARFDTRARLEKNPKAVQRVMAQLGEYFAGDRSSFELPIDLESLTSFQRSVLEVTCRIAPGQVWTYHRVAEELGKPHSSRPVGQALARNPVPIVIPCHRVIASDGSLQGYSGGSGLDAKRWLLRLEGAL